MSREEIEGLIFSTLDEVNAKLPAESQITKSLDVDWIGIESNVDSLGLTFFVIAIEQNLQEKIGKAVQLTEAQSISLDNSPFRNGQVLLDYIQRCIN